MAKIERIELAPGVLAWARKTAGFHETPAAAKRLDVRPEQLDAWESGEQLPTVRQVRLMAKLYRRPFAVLLLPTPPADFDAMRDFRRTGADGIPPWTPALHAEFKRAISQREVLLELAELAAGSVPSSADRVRLTTSTDVESAATKVRGTLGIDDWPARISRSPARSLRAGIESAERLGILILQTRDISITEMRGFSISEWPYPVIVLNGSDWPRPRLFTLIHEFVHLALNDGGVCDLHDSRNRSRQTDSIEHYCNQVAAATLVPKAGLEQQLVNFRARQWTTSDLSDLSQLYPASSEAILIRLISLGYATWDDYRRLKPELEQIYAERRAAEKERQRNTDGGPSYYTVKARNLGQGYVQSVLDAFYSRAISSFDVADYLDIKFDQLAKLQEAVRP